MNEEAIIKVFTAAFIGLRYNYTIKDAVKLMLSAFPQYGRLILVALNKAEIDARGMAYAIKEMGMDKAKAGALFIDLITKDENL